MSVEITYKDEKPIEGVRAVDAIASSDYIEAWQGGLDATQVRIRISDTTNQNIAYLSKKDAIEFGKALVKLGEQG